MDNPPRARMPILAFIFDKNVDRNVAKTVIPPLAYTDKRWMRQIVFENLQMILFGQSSFFQLLLNI